MIKKKNYMKMMDMVSYMMVMKIEVMGKNKVNNKTLKSKMC
jgi:hypothetical protein